VWLPSIVSTRVLPERGIPTTNTALLSANPLSGKSPLKDCTSVRTVNQSWSGV
jgi:hypothetical protein